MNSEQENTRNVARAVSLLRHSRHTTAFTGAGISVESGIPPFRGMDGIWNRYDPESLEIGHFLQNPEKSWQVIRQIFYSYFNDARPNKAHRVLARMEIEGLLACTITQNIDNLHQEAGSKRVFEFHGNSKKLVCLSCMRDYSASAFSFDHLPPTCFECGGLLKPDFVFFGESIPQPALIGAFDASRRSEVLLVIGTTGEVMPANQVPVMAKQHGATIIEINPEPSNYTNRVTDIFLQGKASEIMGKIEEGLFASSLDNDQYRVD